MITLRHQPEIRQLAQQASTGRLPVVDQFMALARMLPQDEPLRRELLLSAARTGILHGSIVFVTTDGN